MNLESNLDLKKLAKMPNIAEELSEHDLREIGAAVISDWQLDKNSRYDWEDKTAESLKLALQVMDEKTFPWAGASNIKFPLVTIAALQYQARAYPNLIPDVNVVKTRVIGSDPNGIKSARAQRISQFMSYQVLEEDECWEENMDRVLIAQAIVGCAFKKTYFDPVLGHNISTHVLAKDLYIPYFAESLEKASRITQVLYCSENSLVQKYRNGIFLDFNTPNSDVDPAVDASDPLDVAEQEAQGITMPIGDPSSPYELLEQHRYLDLDGDGYQEPYIVTVRKDTERVLRIVARFSSTNIQRNRAKEVTYIEPDHYYTKFPFIPSPDGGIYDLGFGVLLGPLNESINTILNQLVDAGTLSNTAGGFLGRGVKFRSGDNAFRPFEWKRVDSTGDDLRKGVFPLPVRDPSPVLFQLLDLLINYGERIGMAVDPLVGVNPGQNTPAETSRNMIAEGQRVFGAVFKRTYRALKEEFRKLYKLNGIYLEDEQQFYSLINEGSSVVFRTDFAGDGKDVVPAADPNMITDEQKLMQAQMLKANAAQTPGYNTYNVEKQFLQALKIPDIESIYPDPKGPNALPPPGPDPKIAIETMKVQLRHYDYQTKLQLKQFELSQEMALNQAKIVELQSQSALNLAQADGIEKEHQIQALQNAISLAKNRQDSLMGTFKILKELNDTAKEAVGSDNTGRIQPLVTGSNNEPVPEVPNETPQ